MANYVAHLQPELAVNYCQLVVVWVDDPAATRTARQELGATFPRESAKVEPALAGATAAERYQFERQGYFSVDRDSRPGAPVFNRTVTLKDTWAKIAGRG